MILIHTIDYYFISFAAGIPTQRRQTISAGGEQSGMESETINFSIIYIAHVFVGIEAAVNDRLLIYTCHHIHVHVYTLNIGTILLPGAVRTLSSCYNGRSWFTCMQACLLCLFAHLITCIYGLFCFNLILFQ